MGKVEKYEKLNKPGLWFVCSGQPATELKQYVYDFAVESGLPIVVYSGIPNAENGGYPPTQNGDIRSLFMLFTLMAMQN
jgi:hypothetical protein